MLLGEVVQGDGVQQWSGDAFGAVEDGFDGGPAYEAGQAADPACGPFMQARRELRQAARPVRGEVEGLLQGGDQLAERLAAAGAGGQRPAVDQ
ncbi:hypothetical protein ACFY30_18490 [Streptomyces sp. NPDC000345]|uniref:hypothetical protein n=1 Tax=Streptomyces sp. NPDC000345 TaxID=3364537 RepID=UPI00367370AB